MQFNKHTKNKVFELRMFEKSWSCVIDAGLTWTVDNEFDYPGLYLHLVLFGYRIIDLSFYDTSSEK